jgi:hypothetical protein
MVTGETGSNPSLSSATESGLVLVETAQARNSDNVNGRNRRRCGAI